MRASLRIALATAIAIVTLGAVTSIASAESIRFSTASSTQTTPITLRDSALGNFVARITLTITLLAGPIGCPANGTVLVQVGGLLSGSIVITTPAGLTGTIAPALVYIRCVNGVIQRDGQGRIILWKLSRRIILRSVIGTLTYTGDLSYAVPASPAATFTGLSAAFTNSTTGSSAAFLTPWTTTNSPTIGYTII